MQLDGQSLNKGTVSFHSTRGGPVAYGRIQPDGSYSLQTGEQSGLHPGKYRITVVATEMIAPASELASPTGRLITPTRYANLQTTDLAADVAEGHNRVDLKLTP